MTESTRPPHDDERCASGDECFRCHVRGLTLGLPSDMPTRTNYAKNPPRQYENAYERGVPTSVRPDGSVMPYIRADGDPMYQREFDAKRHAIDDNRRRIEATASAA
jgi:hypothetical protein